MHSLAIGKMSGTPLPRTGVPKPTFPFDEDEPGWLIVTMI